MPLDIGIIDIKMPYDKDVNDLSENEFKYILKNNSVYSLFYNDANI